MHQPNTHSHDEEYITKPPTYLPVWYCLLPCAIGLTIFATGIHLLLNTDTPYGWCWAMFFVGVCLGMIGFDTCRPR